MLTQKVIVCTSCKAEHELGLFTYDHWWTFGKMFELLEMEPEIALYDKVEALLTSFPGLETLHRETWKLWRDTQDESVVEWIREKIPESNNWEFSDEDLEVLNYADSCYTQGKRDGIIRKRDELQRNLKEQQVACPSCGEFTLKLVAGSLDARYGKALTAWSYSQSGNILPALIFSTVMFCVGLVAMIGPFMTSLSTWIIGSIWCVAVPIAAISGIAAWCMFDEFTSQVSTSVFRRRTHRDPLLRREATFRGQYHVDRYRKYFEWVPDNNKGRRCDFISLKDANWDWLSEIYNEEHPENEDITAIFDLEFRGTLLAAKPEYGAEGRFLLEIEEVLSAKLVTVDYYDGASKVLVRPSQSEDNQLEQQHLLRPTVGVGNVTTSEQLLRPLSDAKGEGCEVNGAT